MSLVVLVGADPIQARLIVDNLGAEGHDVFWARHEWEALLLIDRTRPDLLIVDCSIEHWYNFLTIVRKVRGLQRIPSMLITQAAPAPQQAGRIALAGCIEPHFDAEKLVQQVQSIIASLQRSSRHGIVSLKALESTQG